MVVMTMDRKARDHVLDKKILLWKGGILGIRFQRSTLYVIGVFGLAMDST